MRTFKRLLLILILVCLSSPIGLLSQSGPEAASTVPPSIIPKPTAMKMTAAMFRLGPETHIYVDDRPEIWQLGEYLSQEIRRTTGLLLPVSKDGAAPGAAKNSILLTLKKRSDTLGPEGYELKLTPAAGALSANTPQGLFYGIQTIRQLLPAVADGASISSWGLPCIEVQDMPRFGWRGMLLDCCRHFMSKEFVKRYIDLLASYKMNRFHWHLTEDQGWRIEIKKYPKLTEVGAWRRQDNGEVYGGFYTQEEIKEVVAYAASRHVMVIPEIEMPGHSSAAIASYPEISCTGGPFVVQTYWGIHPDVYCAGNDRTFEVLQDVLTEVIDLFPAPYVHIGGDECPKDRWKACPKCQARIKAEGLKDEHELQSYFIKRIEKFLLSKNRRLIGWDEILEGGLAPQATVQSWRGFEGAVHAARSGHDTIVSPTSHAYFDYDYRTTDLRKVYSFEPVPTGLTPVQSRHILGGECNMWTEYTPQETIDGMMFPRLLAMAERLWSPVEAQDFEEFAPRAERHRERLLAQGVQVGAGLAPVTLVPSFDPETRKVTIALRPEEKGIIIHYSTDGSTPTIRSLRYDAPLTLVNSCTLKARAFKEEKPFGETASQTLIFHAAQGKPVQLRSSYSRRYAGGGDYGLTNGLRAALNNRDGLWQGFEGVDMEAVVDLGEMRPVQRLACGFFQNGARDIFLPTAVEFALSDDGTNFRPVGTVPNYVPKNFADPVIKDFSVETPGAQARYVRVRARSIGTCPQFHPAAGEKAWLFADEIVVD